MTLAGETLERLRAVVEAERGLLADALVEPRRAAHGDEGFGSVAAAGERAAQDPPEYALLVESIMEGYLLHYASSGRILAPDDPDLCLLGGDYLYALGLARLAGLGDLEAVAELADLITLCAQAHARTGADDGSAPWRLASGLWALAALAVGDGGWPEQRQAKEHARAGDPDAAATALAAAHERAAGLGGGLRLEQALIAFDRSLKGDFSATER